MVRCLLGLLVITAGLVVLASANRGKFTVGNEEPASGGGPRLRETEAFAQSGASRTLFRPLPALDIAFSLN
jgi:hypothetical protein